MEIVIIGGGFAGTSALEMIMKTDSKAKVILISKEKFYSPASLFAYVEGKVKKEDLFLRPSEYYTQQNVEAIFGRKAIRLDAANKRVYLDDGNEIGYDKLLIATGASPVMPRIPGIGNRGVLKFATLADAEELLTNIGRKTVIVGAGPNGLELAAALINRGVTVTVVEMMPRVAPKAFGEEVAQLIVQHLTQNGVEVRLNERLIEICGDPVQAVRTDKADIPCDSVVMTVGLKPNVDFIDEKAMKLGESGGIQVDRYLKAAEDIYAAGDCAEGFDFLGRRGLSLVIPTAIQMGRTAALNMMGTSLEYPGSITVNVITLFGLTFASVGVPDGETIKKQVGNKLQIYIRQDNRLVGAQFVGAAPEAALVASAIRRGELFDSMDSLRKSLFQPRVFPSGRRSNEKEQPR